MQKAAAAVWGPDSTCGPACQAETAASAAFLQVHIPATGQFADQVWPDTQDCLVLKLANNRCLERKIHARQGRAGAGQGMI